MREYDTTVFDDIIQKEFSKLLDYPIDYFYKASWDDLITGDIKLELES